MASSCAEICALLLALAGFSTLVFTTMSSRWKVLDTTAELVTADWVSEGLWMDCAATAPGSVECKRILYMLNSDSKWSRHMFIKSKAGVYSFFLDSVLAGWGAQRAVVPEGLVWPNPAVLADKLKGHHETSVHPAVTAVALLPSLVCWHRGMGDIQ